MFVLTEDSEILNLAQCIKIVVIRKEIKANTTASYPPETNLIASFENEVDAGYACFELFKALKAGERTWDPRRIKPLSDLWDKVEKHFEKTGALYEFTGDAKISAFRLDQVTIKYDAEASDHLRQNTIAKYQKEITKKLRELLGDTSIDVEWTS